MKKTIEDLKNLENKVVLVRVDFNVPITNGKVRNDKRIIAALPTIKYLIATKSKIVLFSHLGRVKSEDDKKNKSLKPIAQILQTHLNQVVKFISQTRGNELEQAIKMMENSDVLMLENTRFEDFDKTEVKRESKNDAELGKYWASLGDVFINDAFGTTHRAHASNVGIAKNIKESAIGFLVANELKMLKQGLDHPKRPLISIVGGAKISDKIGIIDALLKKSDKVIICGGMAYTFYVALGHKVGTSLLEGDKVSLAKKYLDQYQDKVVLPIDVAIVKEFKDIKPIYTKGRDIPDDMMGLDIGPKSIALFEKILTNAKTIIWNGPAGVFEMENFSHGTIAICKAIAKLKDAFTLIGGGDSALAAIKLGFEKYFTHISTGGGASLQFMEGKPLPGVEIIQNK